MEEKEEEEEDRISISQRETESGGETEVRPTSWRGEDDGVALMETRGLNYSQPREAMGAGVM